MPHPGDARGRRQSVEVVMRRRSGAWFSRAAVLSMCCSAVGCGTDAKQAAERDAAGADAATPVLAIQSGTTIHVTGGTLRGKTDGATREFLGVPYAKPPTGALRWAPP